MTVEEITRGFAALTEADFEDAAHGRGPEQLDALCDATQRLPQPEQAMEAMFGVMERLATADLGAPGPLVHTLETFPAYEASLFASFHTKPTPLTAWMLNRILNSTRAEEKRLFLRGLLEQAASHPLANEETKQEAAHYLAYQADR